MTAPLPLLGSHVELSDPFAGAALRDAHVVQVNLSAPQTWRTPVPRSDPERWRTWEVPVYVHAPYLLNASSVREEMRQKTRTSLHAQAAAAAEVGARGLIVHAGHPTADGTLADAVFGWVEVLADWEPPVPILIENTAGGKAGPGRTLEGLELLYRTLSSEGLVAGFCLDTCHAHAAGLNLDTLVPDILDVVGRIDLVHVNDSRDPAGSGRDRHANLGQGTIGLASLAAIVAEAGAPAVVETPGGVEEQRADIAALRAQLTAYAPS